MTEMRAPRQNLDLDRVDVYFVQINLPNKYDQPRVPAAAAAATT
eukprot:SAG22_NODE_10509_length_531_cov_0.717593_1_plen_44_part_00